MSLVKRLLSLLWGESERTLEPALGLGGQVQTPNSQVTTLFPDANARFGHYQILEVLGRSSSGAIYRARDDKHARQVALKIPDVAARELPVLHASLETEGRMMAVLNHPNLQQVYELGEELGTRYLAVELVMGTSLRSAIEQGIGLKAGLRALVEVLAGLAAAHERRIVHRNINPASIILQDRGPVKIVGFDMAVPFHASAVVDGAIVGTPAYISPEQARGEVLDGRSDLFSVGCVLYEITAGRPPFQPATITEMLEKIDKEEPEMSGFGPEAGWKALRIVIARALRRNVDGRYSDATAMSAALTGALQGLRAEVFPPTQRRP
jgi:eukaryotic-like serine/threonine-protein kinase